MANYAKVIIVTQKKEYQPGEKLPSSFPEADLKRLKKQGFIYSELETDTEDEDYNEDVENNTPEDDGFGFNEEDFEDEEISFLSEDELRKMKKKKDIVDYAATIGLELSPDDTKEELIDAVLNHIEELQAEA